MRTKATWAAVVFGAVALLALTGSSGERLSAQEPATPESFVVVRYDVPGVAAAGRTAEGAIPTLAQLGYTVLPVPPGRNRDAYLSELRRTAGVASAEPSAQVLAAAAPSDPYYATNQALYFNPIGAPGAWDVSTGRDTVIVA